MTRVAWRIAVDAPTYEADDLTGKGAETTGGRWNRPGSPMVYASSTIALACLETLAHLASASLPLNRFLVRIEIPDPVMAAASVLGVSALPAGWTAQPPGRVSLDLGERWLASMHSAILIVPSVVVPEELNVLINPRHPQTARLKAVKLRQWLYDARLS